jgi:hypothetical protein
LLLAHVIGGLLFAGLAIPTDRFELLSLLHPDLRFYARLSCIILFFSQSCLLGVWAAFSGASWWKRLLGLIFGSVTVATMISFGFDDYSFSWMALTISAAVSGALLVVRLSDVRLLQFAPVPASSNRKRLRFSIRGLMLLTLVAAILIDEVRISIFLALCLGSVWVSLGVDRVLRGIAISIVFLFVASVLFALVFVGLRDRPNYFITIGHLLLMYAILLGSLLVVRSCGYRLLRVPPGWSGDFTKALRTDPGPPLSYEPI